MSDEDIPRLNSEIARLSTEVDDLRRRLEALESAPLRVPPPLPRPRTESQFGLTAVNRIGALTLAIGVIFFFKYAVDNAWIGPGARILLGFIAGLALIATAEWMRGRSQPVFSQGLAGCGLATLYITCYAAFAWYGWFSQFAAATSLVLVSAFAVLLSLRYAHAAIAALGFSGAVLTPILLRKSPEDAGITLPFLLFIGLTSLAIAYKRQWPLLVVIIGIETLVAGFYLTPSSAPDRFVVFALALGLLHLAATMFARTSRPLHDALYGMGHAFIVAGLLREVVLWTGRVVDLPSRNGAQSEFGSLFLAAYGIAGLALGITRRSDLPRTLGLTLIAIVIGKLYLWDVWFLQRLYRMSAFGMLGILLLGASWIYSRAKDAR